MTAIERTTWRTNNLVTFGAVAAVIGGGLRVASSFVPYTPQQPWLETLYGVIDLCLLFGLISAYLAFAEELAMAGLAGFVVALAGLASIVGPDATEFGVDFYQLGALVFLVGLAGMSVLLLMRRALVFSAVLWLAALAFTLAGAAMATPLAITGAGALLGAGFVVSGLSVLRRPER